MLALLVIMSCNNSENNTENYLRKIIGKKIVLPEDLLLFNSVDTSYYNAIYAPCKLVTIIDSASCSECRIKSLYVLKSIVDKDKTSKSRFIVIFDTKDIYNTEQIFEKYKIKIPFFIDLKHNISKMNEIPDKRTFQTFLLIDEKVIVAGDPTYNSTLYELYIKQIKKLSEIKKGKLNIFDN